MQQQELIDHYRMSYQKYFEDIAHQNNTFLSNDDLKRHKITIISNHHPFKVQYQQKPFIHITYTQNQAKLVSYIIIIGNFKLQIILLNINKKAEKMESSIAEGSFGKVRVQSIMNKKFIVKRQYFRYKQLNKYNFSANKTEIEQIIKEYAMCKICSLYKIGPAVDTQIGFDILCYDDCTQFHLQLCGRLDLCKLINQYKKFQKNTKSCLYQLHKLKLIHRDIKPDNILYSYHYQKYVLSDFGLSHPVQQQIGQFTSVYFEGTYQYMSSQMKKLEQRDYGLINVYENDRYGLQQTLNHIKFNIEDANQYQFEANLSQNLSSQQCIQVSDNNEYLFLKTLNFIINHQQCQSQLISLLDRLNERHQIELLELVQQQTIEKYQKMVLNSFKRCKNYQNYQICKTKIFYIESHPTIASYNKATEYKIKNFIRIYGQSLETIEICKKIDKIKYSQFIQQMHQNLSNQTLNYDLKLHRTYQLIGDQITSQKILHIQIEKLIGKNEYDKAFNLCKFYMGNKIQNKEGKIIDFLGCLELKDQRADILRHFFLLSKKLKYNNNFEESNQFFIKLQNIFQLCKSFIITQQQIKQNEDVQIIYEIYIKKLIQFTKFSEAIQFIQKLQYYANQLNLRHLLIECFNNRAFIYFSLFLYYQSLDYCSKAQLLCIELYGEQYIGISQIYRLKAHIYSRLRLYDKSLEQINKCLLIKLRMLGKQNYDTTKNYSLLSQIYLQSNQQMSILYLEKYIDALKRYDNNEIEMGSIFIDISRRYIDLGNNYLALQYTQKSLELNKKNSNQQLIIKNYCILSEIQARLGNHKKALQCMEKSMVICNQLKNDSYSKKGILTLISDKLHSLSQYETSLEFARKALQIEYTLVQTLEENSNLIMLIGDNLRQMKKFSQSQKQYMIALSMNVTYYKNQNYILAKIYEKLGYNSFESEQFERSLQFFYKSIQIFAILYGNQNIDIANIYQSIADVYISQKNQQKAFIYLQKSQQLFIKCYGKNHLNLIKQYYKFIFLYLQNQNYENSLQCVNKQLKINQRFRGARSFQVAQSYKILSYIEFDIKMYKDSYEHIMKCIQINREIKLNNMTQMAQNLIHLIKVLQNLCEFEKLLEQCEKNQKEIRQYFGQPNEYLDEMYYHQRKALLNLKKIDQFLELAKNKYIPTYKKNKKYRRLLQIYYQVSQILQNKKLYIDASNYLSLSIRTSKIYRIQYLFHIQIMLNIYKKSKKYNLMLNSVKLFLQIRNQNNTNHIDILGMLFLAEAYYYRNNHNLGLVYSLLAYEKFIKANQLEQLEITNSKLFQFLNKQYRIIEYYENVVIGTSIKQYIKKLKKQQLLKQLLKIKRIISIYPQSSLNYKQIATIIYKYLNISTINCA